MMNKIIADIRKGWGKTSSYLIAIVASLFANFAFAATWYVTLDAHNADYGEAGETASGNSWSEAITLTNAVAKAQSGDTILVEGGTYDMTKYAGAIAVTLPITIKGGMLRGAEEATVDTVSPYSTFDCKNTIAQAVTVTTATSADDWNVFERCVFTGGKTRGFYKSGATSLKMLDCKFTLNAVSTKEVSGRGGYFTGIQDGTQLVLSDCVFSGNSTSVSGSSSQYGMGAYMRYFKKIDMSCCTFLNNGVPMTGAEKLKGGAKEVYGYAFWIQDSKLVANGCKIIGNRAATGDYSGNNIGSGGIGVLSNCDGSALTNCLWLANQTTLYNKDSPTNSGRLAKFRDGTLVIRGGTVTISRNTFAYNISDTYCGSAGICVESTGFSSRVSKPTGTTGNLILDNSIFFGNLLGVDALPGCGADLYVLYGSKAEVSNTIFSKEECASAMQGGVVDLNDGIQYIDPLFVTSREQFLNCLNVTVSEYPRAARSVRFINTSDNINTVLNFDVHLLSPAGHLKNGSVVDWYQSTEKSIAIDAGSSDCDELEPAGSLGMELGFYGNTPEASKSFPQGTPVIVEGNVEFNFNSSNGKPFVKFTPGVAEDNSDYKMPVYVTFTGIPVGKEEAESFTVVVDGIQSGLEYIVDLPQWFKSGTAVQAEIRFSDSVYARFSNTAPSQYPDFVSAGSKSSNVIHYWKDAPGRGDGSSWAHAYTSFNDAIEAMSETKNVLWIAGNSILPVAAKTINFEFDSYFIGGFKGTESELSDRAEGVLSVLNGNNNVAPFKINGTGKVYCERLSFEKGYSRSFVKEGTGDLMLENCVISGAIDSNIGCGCYFGGSEISTVELNNCIITNNVFSRRESGNGGQATGGYFTKCKKIILNNCSFVGNGSSSVSMRDGIGGAAFYVVDSPVTAIGCKFIGNENRGKNGGIVKLTGACGNSAFTNCVWFGNADTVAYTTYDTRPSNTGCLTVEASTKAAKVDVVNSTFAYNLADGNATSTAGLNVSKGTVNVVNSIFYGAILGTSTTAKHIYVGANGVVSIEKCMLEAESDVVVASGGTFTTTEVIYGDPLFVYGYDDFVTRKTTVKNTAISLNSTFRKTCSNIINVHLRGAGGYFDENTGAFVKGYKGAEDQSPAIDAGLNVFDEFKERNGRKVNLGFYGNTPWATMSDRRGMKIIIR